MPTATKSTFEPMGMRGGLALSREYLTRVLRDLEPVPPSLREQTRVLTVGEIAYLHELPKDKGNFDRHE